ncbi:WD40 repeat-like protein [Auricularia subglabra TFB-10046 SS5]|nr:WD40 repeat-like protein [Auricularia subglabra TFB-10046 SS5]
MYERLSAPVAQQTVTLSSPESKPTVFWRSARWCWDGSAILAHREDKSLQVWNDPGAIASTSSSIILPQAAPVLDACWYPGARTSDPASYCFLASVRDAPVKLLDATDGRLRASYRIVDHVERFVAPHCIAFNCTATKIYCGHRDAIEAFDIHMPGDGERLRTTASKKAKGGLKGIVSSIAFCPDYSGIYAAGSFSSALWLFSEETGSQPVCRLKGTNVAITQVKFHPTEPHFLYAAARQYDGIYAWDIRNPALPLAEYERKAGTNQRLWIDVDPTGAWLVSGDEDGDVSFFDLASESSAPAHKWHAHEGMLWGLLPSIPRSLGY